MNFVDANSVNSNCWWSNDHFTIKNVDHGNDQVLNKNQQKSNVLSGIVIFRTYTTLFIFSIFGELGETHLKMYFNRAIDGTESSLKSYWVSVKYTQRPLKVNKPWFSVLFTKIEIARNTTENGLQTAPI